VDNSSAQHLHDFPKERVEDMGGLLRREVHVDQSGGRLVVFTPNKLHHEHTFGEGVGEGNANPGGPCFLNCSDLGVVPGVFCAGATVATALVHGPLLTAVSYAPPLGVLRAVLEAPELCVFVDLRDPDIPLGDHKVDLGLLAAHERAQDVFDDPEFEQGF
jgi:hypothetical protein